MTAVIRRGEREAFGLCRHRLAPAQRATRRFIPAWVGSMSQAAGGTRGAAAGARVVLPGRRGFTRRIRPPRCELDEGPGKPW